MVYSPELEAEDSTNRLNRLGIEKRMGQDYDGAMKNFHEALQVPYISENGKAETYVNIADIQRVGHADFAAAHSSLDDALAHASFGGLVHAKAVDQRGLVFVAQKEYDCAIASYVRAEDICAHILEQKRLSSTAVEDRYAQIVQHLGEAYVRSGDEDKIEEAYTHQNAALEIFTKLDNQQGIVNAVRMMGRIADIKGDFQEAISQYEKAMKILQKTGYERAICTTALYLLEAHLKNDDPEKAAPYLERFSQGVLANDLTEHDIGIISPIFKGVVEQARDLGMDEFSLVEAKFNS